jgi:hypothetical protein
MMWHAVQGECRRLWRPRGWECRVVIPEDHDGAHKERCFLGVAAPVKTGVASLGGRSDTRPVGMRQQRSAARW